MNEYMVLTPAQIDFCRRMLPGFDPAESSAELAGRAASQRYFVRIRHQGGSVILIVWDSRDEDWERFLTIGRERLRTSGLLPEIIAEDPGHGLVLEEDLGQMTLKRYCGSALIDRRGIDAAYRMALDALVCWQSPDVAALPVIAARSMDFDTFMWESSYFGRYCVTDFCGCEPLLGAAWEQERAELARCCAALTPAAIHRDFQSENIMLHKGRIRLVDFQGARLGPPEYDAASLLFDPYCEWLDDALRSSLYEHFCLLRNRPDEHALRFCLCAAQRLMQALGAFGNLSLHKGKEWYRSFIPRALERLERVMESLEEYPAMTTVVRRCREKVAEGNALPK